MRIHVSAEITSHTLFKAAEVASNGGHGRVSIDAISQHGSKSHAHAFEIRLTGDGSVNRRRINQGTRDANRLYGEDVPYSATYDSWGWFLGYLYEIDPTMKCGIYYSDFVDFHDKTDNKYIADNLPTAA